MNGLYKDKEKRLPFAAVFFSVLLSSAALTFIIFYLQFYNMDEITFGLKTEGLKIFLLNFLPVLLFMLLFLFLTNRLSIAFFITSLVAVLLSLINRTKIILRQDPLVPTDFSLGTEALTIVMKMEAGSVVKYALILIAIIAIGAVLIIFIKNKKFSTLFRITGTVVVITACVTLNNTVYSNKLLYDSLPVGSLYYLVSHYNTKGFLYSLIYQMNDTGLIDKKQPEGYKKAELLRTVENEYPAVSYSPKGAPHIVIVMGEAFSDLSNNADLDFTNYRDPLKNYNKLKKEGVSGEIISAHTGGGTSDTEFDMLTGMSKRDEESVSYAFRLLSKPTESLASNLNTLGYKSIFIHPGTGWFYNRRNVYNLLGFEDLYFSEYFQNSPTKGGYINEYDTISTVINIFEEKRKQNPGEPVFEFCVSIQNHGPYENKYQTWELNFNTEADLTDSEINILSNYFQGVTDQDEGLGRLADYLNALDEPVLLLYFGDHMPSMPASLFKNIGIDFDFGGDFNKRTELFTTPYLFWQNNEYKRQIGKLSDIAESGKIISANYLGAELLELAGYGEISSFSKFLNILKREVPVLTKDEFITNGGYKAYESLSESEKEKILLYKQWQYYKLYDD